MEWHAVYVSLETIYNDLANNTNQYSIQEDGTCRILTEPLKTLLQPCSASASREVVEVNNQRTNASQASLNKIIELSVGTLYINLTLFLNAFTKQVSSRPEPGLSIKVRTGSVARLRCYRWGLTDDTTQKTAKTWQRGTEEQCKSYDSFFVVTSFCIPNIIIIVVRTHYCYYCARII